MKRVTIKDVAALSGVSVSSVSRYINVPTSINSIAAVKVQDAIKQLNYAPSPFAQNLRRGYNDNIGIIVPDLGLYFSSVCKALSQFFYQNKYMLFICETGDDPEKERYYINSLVRQRVAGILIASCGKNNDFIKDISSNFKNIITFDRYEPDINIDAIYEDNIRGAYILTKHMLEKGIREFALLYGMEYSVNTKYRLEGTEKALREYGLDINNMFIRKNCTTPQTVYDCVKGYTERHKNKAAIIAYNPLVLEGCVMALNVLNKSIPDDVQLAGFALEDFKAKYKYDIPCLIQNPYYMGMKAGEMMLKKLKKHSDKGEPKNYTIETTFEG
ncbi:MAG: LacI family DNA-binding transcriptional regulator [Clostridia bacterium]